MRVTRPRPPLFSATLAGAIALALAAAAPVSVAAQTATPSASERAQTLASIRSELNGLYGQIQALRAQIGTPQASGGTTGTQPVSGTVQDRLDAIEARLTQLTNQTEELQHRISTVVSDGTRRIGDLNFRLCELEKGCDIGKLKKEPTLGLTATTPKADTPDETGTTSSAPDLAVGEKGDFDAAKAALDKGDYQKAEQLFGTFTQTYTAGPLTGQAHFYRGEALTALGKTADAARAYLNSFSGSPKGPRAPDALTKLGISLGKLGQVQEACVTLGQVKVRYPASSAVADAAAAEQSLGCQQQ